MLKGYEERNLSGGTGLSYMQINSRRMHEISKHLSHSYLQKWEWRFFTAKKANISIVKKNTHCKHILCIMLKVFNIKESSYILQQIYLTKKEIKNLFNCCVSEKSKSKQMTLKTMLETTPTVTSFHVPQQNKSS